MRRRFYKDANSGLVLIADNLKSHSLEPLQPGVRGVLKLNFLFPRLDEVLSKARIEELS